MILANLRYGLFRAIFLIAPLLLLFFPVLAEAFSLGPIRVTGEFHKDFVARIEIVTDGRDDLAVTLGDIIDYRRLGLGRPDIINYMELTIANHRLPEKKVVYIRSLRPIAAPSFNLVVKAKLGGGTIVENYFLAVDFQRKLSMDVEENNDEGSELLKIAKKMRRQRLSTTSDESKPSVNVDDDRAKDIIARLKEEERAADTESGRIKEVETKTDAPPPMIIVDKEKPIVVEEPKAEPEDKEAIIARLRKEEEKAIESGSAPVVKKKETVLISEAPEERSPMAKVEATKGSILNLTTGVNRAYKVRGGDSLYRLTGRVGATKNRSPQLVVALWRKNQSAFIKGNMNGLLKGASLSLEGVEEEASTMTSKEARKIIRDQWRVWKKRAVARKAPVVKPKPVTIVASSEISDLATGAETAEKTSVKIRAPIKNAIVAALAKWSKSGENLVKVDLSKSKIGEREKGVVEVTVPKEDGSGKTVTLLLEEKDDGSFTVIKKAPEFTEKPATSFKRGDRRYVVHVASLKKESSAKRMVQILRKKGFNAYQTLANIKGKGDWHRVVIDRFSDKETAFTYARRIRNEGPLSYTRVLDLPYAVKIGKVKSARAVSSKMKKLQKDGVFGAYTVKENSSGDVLMLLGAFKTEKEAKVAATDLVEKGITATVVSP